jgi:hypothetical protein
MDTAVIVLAVAIGAVVVIAVAMVFGAKGGKKELVAEAETKAEDIRAAALASLAAEIADLEKDRRDLNRIKAIENDAERLQALADYANRRRKK